MLTRMGSNFKHKAIKKSGEETPKLRRKSSSSEEKQEPAFEDVMSQLSIPILPESSLHIPLESLTLSCGTFTEIQNAELYHSPVTIKRETSKSKHSSSSVLQKELNVLTQVHHPNILLLMGVVKMDLHVLVTIFEEASNGTLHHLLHQKKAILSTLERKKFLTQLCHVMMFLHDRGWLHTAITSHTILITANSVLKLTGFEMARQLNTTQVENSITKCLGKQWFHWQSPEQLNGNKTISKETDIFSAGLIIWEMCTNAEPWFGYTYDELLMKYESLNCALESEELSIPIRNQKNESFQSCMQHMLQIDPKKRISCFLHVLSQVHKIQALPLSTRSSVSDQIQPMDLSGSLKKAQLLFQPQPQKPMIASSTQQPNQDRDPYTGLKRVSNSWQKLNVKSPSTASLEIVNIHSSSTSNSGKVADKSQNCRKHYIDKLRVKNQFLMQNGNVLLNKIQNHSLHQSQSDSIAIEQETRKGNPIALGSSQLIAQRKYNPQPSHNLLFISETENRSSRSVPIKPASHLNQRTINFKNNCTKSVSKERSIQHGNALCQKLSSANLPYDKSKWENSTPLKRLNTQFGESTKEFAEQQTFAIPYIGKNTYTKSAYLSQEIGGQYNKFNHQSEKNYKSNAAVQETNYMDHKHSNRHKYSTETECRCQKGHEISCNSDAESKENGFESTDSGIFTMSRESDSMLNQVNSTEDLYIDDEFCLEMELDSHMQLLCLFDSACEYSEHFIDSIHSDLTEDKDLS